MKKVVIAIVLGCALRGTSRVAAAEEERRPEPHWGIRPEKSSSAAPLEFARWLARRLNEGMAIPVPLPIVPGPKSAPFTDSGPSESDAICPPERIHCPVG